MGTTASFMLNQIECRSSDVIFDKCTERETSASFYIHDNLKVADIVLEQVAHQLDEIIDEARECKGRLLDEVKPIIQNQ